MHSSNSTVAGPSHDGGTKDAWAIAVAKGILVSAVVLAVVVGCADDLAGVTMTSSPRPFVNDGNNDVGPREQQTPPLAHAEAGADADADPGLDPRLLVFTQPIAALNADETARFRAGESLFRQFWSSIITNVGEFGGSGPLSNENNCASCHERNGRDQPHFDSDGALRGVLFRVSIPGAGPKGEPLPDSMYGDQLQNHGNTREDIPAEAEPHVIYDDIKFRFDDSGLTFLRSPRYQLEKLGYGPLAAGAMLSPRVGPQLVGLGLLDAIPDADILANADPNDADGDGISGRANHVWDVASNSMMLGRFGWKANQPNLKQQNAAAFRNDLGLTVSMFPTEPCNESQKACWGRPTKAGPDVTDAQFSATDAFVRFLEVPPRRNATDVVVLRGEALFESAGCTSCHRSTFTTASAPPLAPQAIHPYTDLLLHDMGPDLADNRPDFEANGQEWRTPPLWGIGLIQQVNDHTNLLHDGRARDIEQAILWHGGEGKKARDAFVAMPSADRVALERFVESL